MKTLRHSYDVLNDDRKTHRDVTVELKTLTVGELRAALSKFPDDAAVFATWEGQVKEITEKCLTLSNWDLHPEESDPTVFMDVD